MVALRNIFYGFPLDYKITDATGVTGIENFMKLDVKL